MIFFDIDGTLLDHKGAELKGIKKFYEKYDFAKKINFDAFRELWINIANRNFNKFLKKELSFSEQRARRIIELFGEFNIQVCYEEALDKFGDYLKVYEESWSAYEDVIPCLKKLKDKKLGIISNGDYEQQIMKLEKIGVKEYFSDIITAGDVGIAKPNIEIFKIACKRNNVDINECCYIGDDVKSDIIPCKEIGMNAIFINREKKDAPNDIIQVENLFEIDKVLD